MDYNLFMGRRDRFSDTLPTRVYNTDAHSLKNIPEISGTPHLSPSISKTPPLLQLYKMQFRIFAPFVAVILAGSALVSAAPAPDIVVAPSQI